MYFAILINTLSCCNTYYNTLILCNTCPNTSTHCKTYFNTLIFFNTYCVTLTLRGTYFNILINTNTYSYTLNLLEYFSIISKLPTLKAQNQKNSEWCIFFVCKGLDYVARLNKKFMRIKPSLSLPCTI